MSVTMVRQDCRQASGLRLHRPFQWLARVYRPGVPRLRKHNFIKASNRLLVQPAHPRNLAVRRKKRHHSSVFGREREIERELGERHQEAIRGIVPPDAVSGDLGSGGFSLRDAE
jgi:hypothetical protein